MHVVSNIYGSSSRAATWSQWWCIWQLSVGEMTQCTVRLACWSEQRQRWSGSMGTSLNLLESLMITHKATRQLLLLREACWGGDAVSGRPTTILALFLPSFSPSLLPSCSPSLLRPHSHPLFSRPHQDLFLLQSISRFKSRPRNQAWPHSQS